MAKNEIDRLMVLDPLDLTTEDITKIVSYERKMRAQAEAGIKPEKQQLSQIEGSAILQKLKLVPPTPTVTRRI